MEENRRVWALNLSRARRERKRERERRPLQVAMERGNALNMQPLLK
jgi:hypothetical protein